MCNRHYQDNYRAQTKFAKVMFLHLSVVLFTGGTCIPACNGSDSQPEDRPHPSPGRNQEDLPPRKKPVRPHPPGRNHQDPPGAVHAGRYGQQAGGTQPNLMHTCSQCLYDVYGFKLGCKTRSRQHMKEGHSNSGTGLAKHSQSRRSSMP